MPDLIQEQVKQAIVAVIQTVSDTGNVFDRVKYTSNWSHFKDTFLFEGRSVRGWWVSIPTLDETDVGSTFDAHWHTLIYPIHTVMSYSDGGDSEPAFDNMLWNVFNVLHRQGVLGLGPETPLADGSSVIPGTISLTVPTVDMRFFGSILCHYAELRLTVGIAVDTNYVP